MDKWRGRERRHPPEPTERLILEVPLGGNLDKLARLFINTVSSVGQAIALALSTPHDNSTEVQKQIDAATAQLKSSTDALDAAVKANKPN